MQTLEFSAKSVQEAKQTAAGKLNVSPDQVHITVLEETKGLFGKSSVRVRAEVIAEPAPVAAPAPVVESKPAAPVAEPASEEEPAKAPKGGRGRRGKVEKAPVAEAATAATAEASEPAAAVSEEVNASPADAEAVADVVRELVSAAGIEVSVKVGDVTGKYVNVILDGKDVAFIVGKHGEVLNALQYLVNIVIGRRMDRQVRATLDGNDYRRRREDALTQLANQIAAQVLERGEEAVLDALPAFERRIVHKALSVIEGISTYSEGEEPNRRVVIAPAD